MTKKRLTQTREFDLLSDADARLWLTRAGLFIGKQGWSFDDFDRDELVYCTAIYLFHVDKLLQKQRQFPSYVVHCYDDDSRFESGSRSTVYEYFKRLSADGKRVGMFHWPDKGSQERLYASPDYPYKRDFGPKED